MKRMVLMILRLSVRVFHYWHKIAKIGKNPKATELEKFNYVKYCTKKANKCGRVTIEAHGLENLPEKDGFIMFPNHQGLYDVLAFLDTCPRPFGFVYKIEVKNIVLIKDIFRTLGAYAMDRKDIKQSLGVINQMTEDVKKGRNFLIFAEGTRSKLGNRMLPMKGGTFKSAVNAKCPIVPVALIDSYKGFDDNSTKPLTVKQFYLQPIYYEEYCNMKTPEIAALVKSRIEAAIAEYENKNSMVE